ncbi:MAG: membrane protein insertase YidC [Bacteroidota bacterium]
MSNNSTLDRNTLTGLFLMGLILVLYSLWFPSNNPDPKGNTQGQSEDTLLVSQDTADQTSLQNRNSEARPTEAGTTDTPLDSSSLLSPFGQHLQGNPETYTLRNQHLELTFNAQGGALNQAKILGYKTYAGDSLELFDGNSLKMSYAMITGDKVWNSSQLYFQPVHDADPRSLSLQVDFGPDKSGAPQQILHRYRLDSAGYRLNFSVQFVNMGGLIRNDYTTMEWACIAPAQERDISEERRLMEVYYRFPGEDPDYMSMSSPNEENLNNNLEWISFRQKFFCAVLGAEDHFDRAQIMEKPPNKMDKRGCTGQNSPWITEPTPPSPLRCGCTWGPIISKHSKPKTVGSKNKSLWVGGFLDGSIDSLLYPFLTGWIPSNGITD